MALDTPRGQPSDSPVEVFRGASAPNTIGYRFTDLDPGANIYIQRDDRLLIEWMSHTAGETLTVTGRVLLPGRPAGRTQPDLATADNKLGDSPFGVIVPFQQQFISTGAGTVQRNSLDLAEGYLLSLACLPANAVAPGQCFVRCVIFRGPVLILNSGYALCGDYATNTAPVGWPLQTWRRSSEGPGNLRTRVVANPGIGLEFSFSPTSNIRTRIQSMQATFTTSAAVANRLISFTLTDVVGLITLGTYTANVSVPASTGVTIIAAVGLVPNVTNPANIYIVLPPVILENNAVCNLRIVSSTANLQGADAWTNINFATEEWLDL